MQKQTIPALEKNLGNMIIDSFNHDNKQVQSLQADMNQRFDTQVHILDDLTHRINLDLTNIFIKLA